MNLNFEYFQKNATGFETRVINCSPVKIHVMDLTSNQGPVVQSIARLTKSLVSDSLSLLVRQKSSVLIFFAEKNVFSAKNDSVFMYNMFEILTSR